MSSPTTFDGPRCSKHSDAIRLSYELPHRVYDAKLYPVRSANGSSIIVYARDGGITVMWKGGRRLKSSKRTSQQRGRKQPSRKTDVISIDSDEEDAPLTNQPQAENALEDEEEEQDPAKPFDAIVATHDIELNSSVYGIAVASLPNDAGQSSTVPGVFHDRIVVAAACSDHTVELVSLPLSPSKERQTTQAHGKKKTPNDVQRMEATASHVHSSAPRGVALSFTNASHDTSHYNDGDVEMSGESKPRRNSGDAWQVLIASHSWGAVGTLAISRLQFASGYDGSALDEATSSTATISLKKMGTAICFNPARYPSPRHSQLLMADSSGAARLFDVAMATRSSDGRRMSASNGPKPQQLQTQLLTTLFTPYMLSDVSSMAGSRNKILDVSWALNGKCIIALLESGQWGLWDYAGAGPQSGERQSTAGPQSVPGTGATKFSIEGQLATVQGSELDDPSASTGSLKKTIFKAPTALAPMTPKTRKTRQESLFTPQAGGLNPSHAIRGKLSVSASSADDIRDESVIIAYGQTFFAIRRLRALWKRIQDTQRANKDTSGQATLHAPALQSIASLSTLGEIATNVSQFSNDAVSSSTGLAHDLLVTAEHRLVIWSPAKLQRKPAEQLESLFSRAQPTEEEQAMQLVDQDRLRRGDLNLTGMDRMLASMNGA